MALAAVAGACGGDDPVEPDPAVAPFVGTWDADSLTLTNVAEPATVANVLDFGSFFVRVEPSGQYTATLEVFGSPEVQIGQLTVSGSTMTLTPSVPAGEPPSTSTYTFVSDDYLVLEGPTDFDFNLDGTDEAAEAYFGLQRR